MMQKMSFLRAVTNSASMSEESKTLWRERCRQMYLGKLIAWACLKNPEDDVAQSERIMRELCEGRDAETLEAWCVELKIVGKEE